MEYNIKRLVNGKGNFRPTKDFFCDFFMSTVTCNKEFLDYIRRKQDNKTYDFDNGTFDVKIIVDGYEIKPEPFFELLERNFDRLVAEKANKRINEMLPDSFSEDMDNMRIKINNVYESMQNDINKIVSKYRKKMLNKHFSTEQ